MYSGAVSVNFKQAVYLAILWGIMLLLLWVRFTSSAGLTVDTMIAILSVVSVITIIASVILIAVALVTLYWWLGEVKK